MYAQNKLTACLHAIEQQLQLLGWWENKPPSQQALNSCEPFCVDTLDFSQWLQWILLPRMHQLLDAGGALPARSAIVEMAELVYAGQPVETAGLCNCLRQLDTLLNAAQG